MRVGNAASDQRQLDAIAALIESIWLHLRTGGRWLGVWGLVDRLAELLVKAPFAESSGVWEFRKPVRLVSEEVARWTGLDRALKAKRLLRPWLGRPHWHNARRAAGERVDQSYDDRSGLLRQSFDEENVRPDAASLLAVINGCFSARDPRSERLVRNTISALEEGPFLRRYPPDGDDGFHGREMAFLPASWWAVSALCAIGDVKEASRRADQMCEQLPTLLPEMWDVVDRRGLGNTPLLWSHTEAARALFGLRRARLAERHGPLGPHVFDAVQFVHQRFGASKN